MACHEGMSVNTDLYVFRESTGELIVELNGLPEGAGDGGDLTENGDYFTYYAYRYGHAGLRCAGLQGFNLFEPIDAIKSMLTFVAVPANYANRNCGRTFSRIIPDTGDWSGATPGTGTPLRGYLRADSTVNEFGLTAATRIDDAYERLMRALAGYNGQTGINRPWAIMLAGSVPSKATRNRNYAIDVMRRFGVPARTYIWRGGDYPNFTTDDEGQQIPHPNAGEEWCFAYGEREWRDEVTYNHALDETERHANNRPRDGDVARRSQCQ
jgi:hypothetical protein